MCVTIAPAEIGGTRAFTYANFATEGRHNWHVTGYQNYASNLHQGPNCMLLHFPGNELRLVDGPQHTQFMMEDITVHLPEIEPVMRWRSAGIEAHSKDARVEAYGDYTVVIAEDAMHIFNVLSKVPADRRPNATPEFHAMVAWYQAAFPGYSYVLACFNGNVKPVHPIVVEYVPHNDDVLFIPGVDGHDGLLPRLGEPMKRDFRVAFGHEARIQPFVVDYRDNIGHQRWAPQDVTGFWDNRSNGPNLDYIVSLEDTDFGLTGKELLSELIS